MYWLALVYLSWLRFQDLALKPVHHDESINGWFTQQVLQNAWYQYDPTNYHGPLLFYVFALGEVLGGWGIVTLRAVTVGFSVLWLWSLWHFWIRSRWASKWFLLVVALSPGFLFFSRSAIHEMPFLFFLTLTMQGLTLLFRDRQSQGWKLLIWGVAGMILLKETWVLFAASALVAALLTWILRRPSWSRLEIRSWLRETASPSVGGHLVCAVALVVTLFTGWMQKPSGLWDLAIAYLPWFKTGVSSAGHEKAFGYWFEILWSFEKPLFFLFLGMFGSVLVSWRRLSLTALWISLTALLNLLIYSLIPYKTPWCLLAVYGPCIFAFGFIQTETQDQRVGGGFRALMTLLALTALVLQWPEFQKLNFQTPVLPNHPYVYVQTDTRLKALVDQLEAAAEKNPELYSRPIQQAGTEAWPMAWALARFPGQIQKPIRQGVLEDALLIVLDAKDESLVAEQLASGRWKATRFPIRDGREDSLFLVPAGELAALPLPSETRKGER